MPCYKVIDSASPYMYIYIYTLSFGEDENSIVFVLEAKGGVPSYSRFGGFGLLPTHY